MVRWVSRVCLFAAAMLSLVVVSSAQFGSQYDVPESDPNAFKIVTPADLEQSFRRIRAHQRDLAQARGPREREPVIEAILRAAQAELNKSDNAVGVISADTDRWLGAYGAVEQVILSLGDEGLALYEKNYGPRAEALLEQARRHGAREAMLDVNRRFGLTKAGVRAATLLAALSWEEGEVSLAARALERALSTPALLNENARANLTAWLGACYQMLGERAHLSQLHGRSRELARREINTGDGVKPLGELLQAQLAASRDSTNDTLEGLGVQWVGGNYSNTGIPPRPADFDRVAWLATMPRLEAETSYGGYMRYPVPAAPPFMPASNGVMLYVNRGDALLAYDIFTGSQGNRAGEPLWRTRGFALEPGVHRRLTNATDPNLILPVSIHRGVVFAALENPLSTRLHSFTSDGRFGLYSHYPQARRAICAVDGETGRLLWRFGGQYEGSGEETTSFVYAVVHQGTLYAIGTRVPGQAEIFLYALDPATGEVRWNLRLCYGQQETTMFGRPSRQPYPSIAAIAAGELYVCTNIGGVVSVNLARRCLTWIARYPYMSRPVTKYIDTYYRPLSWYNSPTMYAEAEGRGFVVCAPTDSQCLVALDANTGEVAWKLDRNTQPPAYRGHGPLYEGLALVGIRNGIVYVAGRHQLYLVELATGRLVDRRNTPPVADSGRSVELAGRPAMAGNRLLWPTTAGLNEIDLDARRVTGSYAAASRVQGQSVYVLNGLTFSVSGTDYSVNTPQIAARFDPARLMVDARLRVAEAPDDPESVLRFGLLQLRLGDQDEGLKLLERAYQLSQRPPLNTMVREASGRMLVSVRLKAADQAITARRYLDALVSVAGAREYATTAGELSDCFVREEACLRAMGETEALLELYRDILRRDPAFGVGSDPQIPARIYAALMLARAAAASGIHAEALDLYGDLLTAPEHFAHQGRRLRLIALAELGQMLVAAGREVYAPHEKAARELLKQGDAQSLRRLLAAYPLAQCADEAGVKLLKLIEAQGDLKAALLLLATLLEERPDRPARVEFMVRHALLHDRAGEYARARLLAQRALREFGERELELDGVKRSVRDWLATLVDRGKISTALPHLPRDPELLWSRPTDNIAFLPTQADGAEPPRLIAGTNEASRGNHLESMEPRDGRVVWSTPGGIVPQSCHYTRYGTLVVTALGLAMHGADGEPLWRDDTGATPHPLDVGNGLVVFCVRVGDPMTGESQIQLTVRDVSNGTLVWQVRVDGNQPHWVRQTDDGIVLLMTGRREAELLLFNPETGSVQRRQRLGNEVRPTAATLPLVRDGAVCMVDLHGAILRFGANLEPMPTLRTGESSPALFVEYSNGFLVAGSRNLVLFDPLTGKNRWSCQLKPSESVIDRGAIIGDTQVLALRRVDGAHRVVGVRLDSGGEAFSFDVAVDEPDEFISLRAATAFSDCVAFVFVVHQRVPRSGPRAKSYRVLVLDADGRARMDFSRVASARANAAMFVQAVRLEGYLIVNCDNEIFCFGKKSRGRD